MLANAIYAEPLSSFAMITYSPAGISVPILYIPSEIDPLSLDVFVVASIVDVSDILPVLDVLSVLDNELELSTPFVSSADEVELVAVCGVIRFAIIS